MPTLDKPEAHARFTKIVAITAHIPPRSSSASETKRCRRATSSTLV